MRPFLSSLPRLVFLLGLFVILLLGVIWLDLSQELKTGKREAVQSAIHRNNQIALSIEQYALRAINNADAVLRLVRSEYNYDGKELALNPLLGKGIIDTTIYNGVLITNQYGDIVNSNIPFLLRPGMNISDRDYFKVQVNGRDELFISVPFESRLLDTTVIVFSRRLVDAEGKFAGVVAVQVSPSIFSHFYSKSLIYESDLLTILSREGVVYTQGPWVNDFFRTPQSHDLIPDFEDTIAGHMEIPLEGNKGRVLYINYKPIYNHKYMVVVGSFSGSVLASYYFESKQSIIFAVILSFLLLAFTYFITRVIIYRKRQTTLIRQSEKKYRSIFKNSRDGIVVVKNSGVIVTMNRAAVNLFQVKSASFLTSVFQLFASSSADLHTFLNLAYADGTFKREIRLKRLNGTDLLTELSVSYYTIDNGEERYIFLFRDITLRREMDRRILEEQKKYQQNLTLQVIQAQEREREVIGHELHDNVNQILTTVKLYLETAVKEPGSHSDLIKESANHIQNCISEVRILSRELSAPTLGKQSIVESIKNLVEMLSRAVTINFHFDHSGFTSPVSMDQNLALYRILQEQFNNIVKHARATEVKVKLCQTEEHTCLVVEDNGKGFDVNALRKGIGLNNILSRARIFGGSMEIFSQPGKGARLEIFLPLTPERMEEIPETAV